MMQLELLTSSFEMKPISDFHYIYDLARCSKCQIFTLLKHTNKLYGVPEYDCAAIHEIDVPFLVNTDLMFKFDSSDRDMLNNYKEFFIPEKFNWVILPDYYWDMYIGGDLISEYSYELNKYIILDKTTKQPIHQIHMYRYRPCDDFQRMEFMNQLSGMLRRFNTLRTPESFSNIHEHPSIRKAFDSKSSMGRFLCRMKNDNIDVLFYFYKALFSLAKADSLDLDIQFDIYETNLFMATFKPKKKKNPLTFNTYGVPFQEKIRVMFINMI